MLCSSLLYITYPINPSSTGRPGDIAPATTSPTTSWSTTSTARTAQVSKVYLQLGSDVIGWLPEVMIFFSLNYKNGNFSSDPMFSQTFDNL